MEDALTKYPIGEFNEPVDYTIEYLQDRIHAIKVLPGEVGDLVTNRTEQQLNDTYRKGGWTFRQIIHHLADSHLHALIRTKYALTEDKPLVKSFEEADWALLPDYALPVESSLKVLEGVHLHLAAVRPDRRKTGPFWCRLSNPGRRRSSGRIPLPSAAC